MVPFLAVLFLCFLTSSEQSSCVADTLWYPCVCEAIKQGAGVYCHRVDGSKMKAVFKKASGSINGTKFYEVFQIMQSYDLDVDDDLFCDFKFKAIVFSDSNLNYIRRNAFRSSLPMTETIIIERSVFRGWMKLGEEVFDILKLFPSLKELTITESNLRRLPENAFLQVDVNQTKLLHLRLSRNQIERIGDYAFYELPELQLIDLSHNRLKHISKNAFSFWKEKTTQLLIDLSYNFLTTKSFEVGAFLNVKRRMMLNLTANNISHITEEVFAPILENVHNQLDFRRNPIICNCKNWWILKERELYRGRLINFLCEDGKTIARRSYDNYRYCGTKIFGIESRVCGCDVMRMINFLWEIGVVDNYHRDHILEQLRMYKMS